MREFGIAAVVGFSWVLVACGGGGSGAKFSGGEGGSSSGDNTTASSATNGNNNNASNTGSGSMGTTSGTGGSAAQTANSNTTGLTPIEPHEDDGACGLDTPAFCERFEETHPGGRGGDVDETAWSVARWRGAFPVWTTRAANTYSAVYNGDNQTLSWDMNPSNPPPTFCGEEFSGILPPDDFKICDGVLNEVYNDGGGLPVNSMRIRQPFDFTNRTGKIVFDVDAKRTAGEGFDGHTWWLEVWVTQDPVPIPYHGAPTLGAFTKGGAVGFQIIPHGPCYNDDTRNVVSRVVVMKDYRILRDDLFDDNPPESACFKVSDTHLNHFEVDLSTDKIEIYVSDYDNANQVRLGASKSNLGLDFSTGYVHFMHVHYNAGKTQDSSGRHPSGSQTFRWDNIGFDGPTYATPRGYDVPDDDGVWEVELQPAITLGWQLTNNGASQPKTVRVEGVDKSTATKATLNFNAMAIPGNQITFSFNGGPGRAFDVPSFGSTDDNSQLGRALSMEVPLDDLVDGTNTIRIEQTKGDSIYIGNLDVTLEVPE